MNWIGNNLPLIGERTLDHIAITAPVILLSFLISVPIGWVANRFTASRGIVLSASGVFYAIPSLPLFVALPVILGTGLRSPVNVTIGLTLYGIALMVRSTADGLASVDPDVTQSATAMGFSDSSRFWRVELPLAGPVLLAGLRVVSVSTVSLATVVAVLGVPTLGLFFTDGVERNILGEIWAGIVMTIVIALVFDVIIVQLGRLLMPWTRSSSAAVSRPGRRTRVVAPV
ncbi:osmoprotectant transport system permease protein [Glaciihabitans tibetensis]|uniref:Osmoprotectant transport system permease protein n=1 Tax=Glaciihabitans tibetensis TaxID=1266600 RepID=A0A2T0VJ01_9MICO|nr:ABC transporter permease [Glaciihabitans tibetensis]PRY70183.1 osmoprotectant transport system permease protein [Glaciihabitans tibetensis]